MDSNKIVFTMVFLFLFSGVSLRDKDGNVLFGKEPSVAECESYDGPNLLLPLYSKKE